MTLSLLNILEDTTVDGPGFRTAIYAAGCGHHCPGCHNPESWDMGGGQETPVADVLERVLADDFADVTFTGGDPMYQPEAFTELARGIHARSRKTIWCYTGYHFDAPSGGAATSGWSMSPPPCARGRRCWWNISPCRNKFLPFSSWK